MQQEQTKRSRIDFSSHELIIQENELIKIHWLKKPNTIVNNVKFINCQGSLIVKGDFGNWIFCREFIPTATKEKVSDRYWDEKLKSHSTQKSDVWDESYIIEAIDAIILELDEMGYEGNELEEATTFFNSAKTYTDNEIDFVAYCRENHPTFLDTDIIPDGKVRHNWLNVIYDAFEEICRRLSDNIINS